MFPGSQSSKIKHATLGISGDPRFRLRSNIPGGGVTVVAAVVAAIVASVVVIFFADGALERQQHVVAANDCVNAVRALVDIREHVYRGDEARSAEAAACVDGVPAIEAEADALLAAVGTQLAAVRAVHGKDDKAERDAIFELETAIDDFDRWHIQNRARYGL